ncbi:MAG: uracil-DNA glycosylase [Magnetococcales bacterium]|nr:uracil-DNA glycosylase [Magnetococcales bacterium]
MADCLKCRHYRVTWDRDHPRGCAAMGFKGLSVPAQQVQRISGSDCLGFEPKETPSPRTDQQQVTARRRQHWIG